MAHRVSIALIGFRSVCVMAKQIVIFNIWGLINNSRQKGNIQKLHVLPTQCVYVFCVDLRTNSDLLRTAVPYVTAFYSKVFTARYDLNLEVQFRLMLASTVHVVAQAVSRRAATTEVRVRSRTSPSEICDEQNGPSTGPYPGTSRPSCQCHSTSAPCVLFLQEGQTGETWEPSEINSY